MVTNDCERLGSDLNETDSKDSTGDEYGETVPIGHQEEVVGEESEDTEIPLDLKSGETITINTTEEDTGEVSTTLEYVGDGSEDENSGESAFRGGQSVEGLSDTGDHEPRTPPDNLEFSFDHFGPTSPGFLDGSELLLMPHELLIREQRAVGIRTTSTTEREEKQRNRRSRRNRGVIERFSPEG